MAAVGTDSQILAFFDGHLPQTGAGALAHARALLAAGHPADEPPKKRARKPLERIVFSESWGRPFSAEPDP
jgi:hypothetical protein